MNDRDKLIDAMHKADLADHHQKFALILHDAHGLDRAMEYVNMIMIDMEVAK